MVVSALAIFELEFNFDAGGILFLLNKGSL